MSLKYEPSLELLHITAETAFGVERLELYAGCRDPLYRGGLDVIRKEAWPFYRTTSGVRLCWELEEPKGPKGSTAFGVERLVLYCRTTSASTAPCTSGIRDTGVPRS